MAVIGLASAPLAGFVMPAHAGTWQQSEWWLTKLHITQAWRGSEGAGVTVAVLADGVEPRQADLTGRVITGPDFTGSNRIAGGSYYGTIGTGLASLIAGHGHGSNSAQGVRGIARQAQILSLRVTLSPGDPLWSSSALTSRLPSDIAAGIRYAVKHGASVIALPADPGMPGIPRWGGVKAIAGGSAAERTAIAYAVRHNVVLVAPAGDNGQAGDAPNFPAAYGGVISIGAFDRNFVKAPFSSHQRYVMLTAAGRGVAAASPSGYQTMNSTWAASAIVAGVASLVRSQFPDLSAAQVQSAMTQGTLYRRPGGLRNGSGYGTVDAAKAISEAATMSPPHAKPASLGALPRHRPVTPSVPSNGAVITRDLLTDTIIAIAILACLLVPITWYGSIIKRRDRLVALAAADRAQHSRMAYGQRGMGADPLDYFEPQEAPAPQAAGPRRSLPGPRYQPRPALSGRSTLTPAFAPRPMLAAPPADEIESVAPYAGPGTSAGGGQADAWGGSGSWPGADAWSNPDAAEHGGADPRSRPPVPGQGHSRTLRHAPVSGAPPWEPAPQPTSELPWAVLSGPAQGQARRGALGATTSQAPPESIWGARPEQQSQESGSLFDPSDPPGDGAGPGPDRRADSDWRSISGRRTSSGDRERPIYIWDPETSADDGTIRLTGNDLG
ncbi:MAG TPA: S8 family serine peptidase [Streptosporangiaceae bacterium]